MEKKKLDGFKKKKLNQPVFNILKMSVYGSLLKKRKTTFYKERKKKWKKIGKKTLNIFCIFY